MCADGACGRGFLADHDMTAVAALPDGVAFAREHDFAFDIRQKLAIAFLVMFFNFADHLEEFRDAVETFFAGFFGERGIHICPFIVLAFGGCEEVFGRRGDFVAVEAFEPELGALNFLLGEHDFSSFKSSGTLNPSKVCLITRAEVEKQGDRVFIYIEGNRFLYNMVRTIVGTLLEIEGHKLQPEHMKDVLEARDRRKAGRTVSPYGLTLMRVDYPQ